MSAPILNFTPRSELEPLANLATFLELCRDSDVLGARSQFEKNVWEIGYLKGHNTVNRAVFSTLEASRINESNPSLPHPFLNFAKASLVYLHDKRPVKSQGLRIAAFRCLEAALRESCKGSRPTAVDEMYWTAQSNLPSRYRQVSPIGLPVRSNISPNLCARRDLFPFASAGRMVSKDPKSSDLGSQKRHSPRDRRSYHRPPRSAHLGRSFM